MSPLRPGLSALLLLSMTTAAVADGIAIGKVYDPYVEPMEREIEYRGLYEHDSDSSLNGGQLHSLGYGGAFADRWFGEIYVLGDRRPAGNLSLDGFELELKRQLTEQGEYAADWGWQAELERSTEHDQWEFSSMLISARDWGRWTGTANLAVLYEWGEHINSELESRFSAQLKYRLSPALEPAIELYKSQTTFGAGPLLKGLWRLGQGEKLLWEAGIIAGLDSDTPDLNFKLNLEYEF